MKITTQITIKDTLKLLLVLFITIFFVDSAYIKKLNTSSLCLNSKCKPNVKINSFYFYKFRKNK